MLIEQTTYLVYRQEAQYDYADVFFYGVFSNREDAEQCAREHGTSLGRHFWPASIEEVTLYVNPNLDTH